MAYKKIKQRNSANGGMGGLVVTILIVIGIFLGSFLYVSDNAIKSGVLLDEKYNNTYDKLLETQGEIGNKTDQLRDNVGNVSEATGIVNVAINGFKGLGNSIKLTFYFINSALDVWTATTLGIDIIPGWIISLGFIGILVSVVFLAIKFFMKGD